MYSKNVNIQGKISNDPEKTKQEEDSEIEW